MNASPLTVECCDRLTKPATGAALQAAYENGFRVAAINFMHGYRYSAHEQRAAAVPRELGFAQVSTGHETRLDEIRVPRRHHGGRRLLLADPGPHVDQGS